MALFKSRVVQVTFSTPGIRAPKGEIDDNDLLEQLKKLIDDRTDFMRKLQVMLLLILVINYDLNSNE